MKRKTAFILTISLLVSLCIGGRMQNVYAASPTATQVLRFTNLPLSVAIQNFHTVDDADPGNGKEIYVTQRSGNNTYLSRCVIGNTDQGERIAERKDTAVLTGYGHGESLEISKYNGKTYLWLGADGSPDSSSYWATQIARLEYVPNASTGAASVKNKAFLHHLRWASGTGSVLESGSITRVSVAMTNTSNNRIAFRIQVKNSAGKKSVHYSVYDLKQLNARMSASGGSYHMKDMKAYHKSNFKMNNNSILPRAGSYQGHEVVGVGSNAKYLYIAGGTGADHLAPQIGTYLYTNGGNVTKKSITTLSSSFNGREIEGLQAVGSKLYFVIKPPSDNKNQHKLYYITRPV